MSKQFTLKKKQQSEIGQYGEKGVEENLYCRVVSDELEILCHLKFHDGRNTLLIVLK